MPERLVSRAPTGRRPRASWAQRLVGRAAPLAFPLFMALLVSAVAIGPDPDAAVGAAPRDPLDRDGNGVDDDLDAWAAGAITWEDLVERAVADREDPQAKAGRMPLDAARPADGPLSRGQLRLVRLGEDRAATEAARARAAGRGGSIAVLHRLARFGGVEVLAADAPGLRALLAAPGRGRLRLDRDGTPALDRSTVLTATTLARQGPWRLEGDWTASVAILDSGCDTAHDDLGDYSHDNRDGPPPAVGDAFDWSPATSGWPTFLEYKVVGWHDVTDDFPLAVGPWDYHAHGTALAGVVAAQGEIDARYRGLGPLARLTVVKFYDFDGVWRQWAGDFLAACDWLLDHGQECRVRVALCAVNWEVDFGFGAVLAQLRAAGILPVCAMGNAGETLPAGYPAALPEAFSIGAVNDAAAVSAYSGRGSADDGKPDLLAPGGGLLPAAGRITTTDNEPNDSYSERWGTSLSAAHVAGGAFLVLEAMRKEGCPPPAAAGEVALLDAILRGTAAVVSQLETADGEGVATALPWAATPDSARGWGLLQVAAAVEAAVSPLAPGAVVTDSLGGVAERRVLARRLDLAPGRDYSVLAAVAGELDIALEVHDARALIDPGSGLTRVLRDETDTGGAERATFRAPPAGTLAFVAVKRLSGQGRVSLSVNELAGAPVAAFELKLGGPITGWSVPARLGSGLTPTLLASGLTAVDAQARLVHALELSGRERSGWPAVLFLPTTLVGNLTAPMAWDLNASAGDEIVVASDYGKAYFVAATGLITPRDAAPANVALRAPVGRQRGDGGREVAIVSDQGNLLRFGAAGELLGTTALGTGTPRAPAVGELDGLPGEEIVVAFAGGRVDAVTGDGELLAGWPVAIGEGPRAPLLIDLDFDGRHEVVCARLAGAELDQLELRVLRADGSAGPGDGTLVAMPPDGSRWLAVSDPAGLARPDGPSPAVVLQGLYETAAAGALERGARRLATVTFGVEGAVAARRPGFEVRGLTPTGELTLRWVQLAPPLARDLGGGPEPEPEPLASLGWEEVIAGSVNLKVGMVAWLRAVDDAPALAQRQPLLPGFPLSAPPSGTWGTLLATADGSALVRFHHSDALLAALPVGAVSDGGARWAAARGDSRNSGALPLAAEAPTAVSGSAPPPRGRLLLAPNPASGQVCVTWRGRPPGEARLAVYDLRGRRVRRLASGALAPEGSLSWDGRAENGRPVASGTYLVLLRSTAGALAARVVVTR